MKTFRQKISVGGLLLLGALQLQSCDYAHSNVTTLVTSDCGQSWVVIKAGEKIPKGVANPCHYKVTIPDYPMQGESRFKIMFKGNVLANIDLGYNYTIINPVMFIGEAKYLGKANASSDAETNAAGNFEMAENAVIDKRIKDVARNMLANEDVVDFNPSDFEEKLLPAVNKTLAPLGIRIDFLSFIPVFNEQTDQAIDVATALKIYESKGLKDVAIEIIKAKAGATRVVVNGQEVNATEKKE
jgi:hypothetical protein